MFKIPKFRGVNNKLNKGIFTGRKEIPPLGKGEEEMQQRSVFTGFGFYLQIPSHKHLLS